MCKGEDDGRKPVADVLPHPSGAFTISIKPDYSGTAVVDASFNGESLYNSPVTISVFPDILVAETVRVYGTGVTGGRAGMFLCVHILWCLHIATCTFAYGRVYVCLYAYPYVNVRIQCSHTTHAGAHQEKLFRR